MKQENPYPLRIDKTIFEKIRYIAQKNKRSINKEIEFVLENYVHDYEKLNSTIILNERFSENQKV
jgi:hypothetical protein